MKITYRTKSNRISVEIEADTQKAIVQNLADFQEVFEQDTCGKCKSQDTRFQVRNVDDNDYFEKICNDCGAKLAYGQNKKGGSLFPKKWQKDEATGKSSMIGSNGWVKFNRQTGKEE